MKLGDCYIDNYFEPDTIVLKVTGIEDAPVGSNWYKCRVVYSSNPHRMEINETLIIRCSTDRELIPVAMITLDNKVILINL